MINPLNPCGLLTPTKLFTFAMPPPLFCQEKGLKTMLSAYASNQVLDWSWTGAFSGLNRRNLLFRVKDDSDVGQVMHSCTTLQL